jgi:hypothetical protein
VNRQQILDATLWRWDLDGLCGGDLDLGDEPDARIMSIERRHDNDPDGPAVDRWAELWPSVHSAVQAPVPDGGWYLVELVDLDTGAVLPFHTDPRPAAARQGEL